MDEYVHLQRIGCGAFGVIVKAKSKRTGEIVAIKRIVTNEKDKLRIARELEALRSLHHPKIVRLLDTFSSQDTLSLVMEFVPFHLNDIILDPRRPSEDSFIRYFYSQILSAVKYMHSVSIMHRDLKPENILVTSQNVVKLADFGQACIYVREEKDRQYEEDVATRWYRSPELLFGCRKYTTSVDVWALGCILAEFLLRRPLFQGHSDLEQISLIFKQLGTPSTERWPSFGEMPDAGKIVFEQGTGEHDWRRTLPGASDSLLVHLKRHLKLEAAERLTAEQLVRLPFSQSQLTQLNYIPSRRRSALYLPKALRRL